jgi:hypothetical protein
MSDEKHVSIKKVTFPCRNNNCDNVVTVDFPKQTLHSLWYFEKDKKIHIPLSSLNYIFSAFCDECTKKFELDKVKSEIIKECDERYASRALGQFVGEGETSPILWILAIGSFIMCIIELIHRIF